MLAVNSSQKSGSGGEKCWRFTAGELILLLICLIEIYIWHHLQKYQDRWFNIGNSRTNNSDFNNYIFFFFFICLNFETCTSKLIFELNLSCAKNQVINNQSLIRLMELYMLVATASATNSGCFKKNAPDHYIQVYINIVVKYPLSRRK